MRNINIDLKTERLDIMNINSVYACNPLVHQENIVNVNILNLMTLQENQIKTVE